MASLSSIKRSWLLASLGITDGAQSEADLETLLYNLPPSGGGGGGAEFNAWPPVGGFAALMHTSGQADVDLNRADVYPILVPFGLSIDQVSLHVNIVGAAGSVGRIFCATQNTDGTFSLVHDFGTIDAAGSTGLKTIVGSWELPAGTLWFGVVAQVAAFKARGLASPGVQPVIRHHTGVIGAAPGNSGVGVSGLNGAIPASFSASGIAPYAVSLMLRRSL